MYIPAFRLLGEGEGRNSSVSSRLLTIAPRLCAREGPASNRALGMKGSRSAFRLPSAHASSGGQGTHHAGF